MATQTDLDEPAMGIPAGLDGVNQQHAANGGGVTGRAFRNWVETNATNPNVFIDMSDEERLDLFRRWIAAGSPSAFGSRRRRRCRSEKVSKVKSNSPCGNRKKADCKATPGCGYTSYKRKGRRIRGCKRKPVYRKRMVSRAVGFGW
jgi:hypothetical protein